MDEVALAVGDAVEGQNARVLVQVDTDLVSLTGTQQGLLASAPEGEARAGPVQAPGGGVVAQPALVVRSLTRHFFVGHADGHLKKIVTNNST